MWSQISSACTITCVEKMSDDASAMLGEYQLAQQPHVHRVEAAEGLVEDQQIGRMQHRGQMSCTFCSMPFESSSHFLSCTPARFRRSSHAAARSAENSLAPLKDALYT